MRKRFDWQCALHFLEPDWEDADQLPDLETTELGWNHALGSPGPKGLDRVPLSQERQELQNDLELAALPARPEYLCLEFR
jgi:hypothetical protein